MCRLIDPEGQVVGVVPIVGSSEVDALNTARSLFKILGGQGSFELWQDKVRIVAHGELTDETPPGPDSSPGES